MSAVASVVYFALLVFLLLLVFRLVMEYVFLLAKSVGLVIDPLLRGDVLWAAAGGVVPLLFLLLLRMFVRMVLAAGRPLIATRNAVSGNSTRR